MSKSVSKYGQEINNSLKSRLEKLEQAEAWASTFMPKQKDDATNLEVMIKKSEQKPACLEMFHELAEEEPAKFLPPQKVVMLLQRKISELKKALAVMADASY